MNENKFKAEMKSTEILWSKALESQDRDFIVSVMDKWIKLAKIASEKKYEFKNE